MVTPSEQMFSAFIPLGEVLLFPMGVWGGALCPEPHPLTPPGGLLPWWSIYEQRVQPADLRLRVRATAHPSATEGVLLGVCREQTFGLGLRLARGRVPPVTPQS